MIHDVKVYLAPFQSITTHTFRRTYAEHFMGIDKFYTPFFAKIDHETKLSEKKIRELKHLAFGKPDVVPQILSKDPEEILRFARICERLGFKELNWNLGCPYPQVASKKRGSGMLPYPEMVNSILDRIMSGINIKFSIKCRLGYESPDEIFHLIPVFNSYPLHELTVHGRIGKQLYSGFSDHDILALVQPLVKSDFIHNGDILSLEHFKNASGKLLAVSSWMIGRGILNNPFLPEEIKGIESSLNKHDRLKTFLDDLYFAYRVDLDDRLSVLSLLKEFWDYIQNFFPDPQYVHRIIKKAKTFDAYESAVKQVFQST